MEVQYEKAAEKLSEIMTKREKVKVERDEAESKLKELRPQSILKSGGVSKRDLEKYKRVVVAANKKLSKLATKERKPRAAEKKAKQNVEAARKKLATLEERIAKKIIKAPWMGVVVERKAVMGDVVSPDMDLIRLRDPTAARITFQVADAGNLQPGGEAYVAVSGGAPGSGKIQAVEAVPGGVKLEVRLADPAGAFTDMDLGAFRLVREFADPAFSVDTTALVEDPGEGKSSVFIALQGRAVRRHVEILAKNPDKSVIRSTSGSLRSGDQIIVSFPAEGAVGSLLDDAQIEAKEKN
jgi:multidrug efflux pump subunit AcrA (membrane-fusion protein)